VFVRGQISTPTTPTINSSCIENENNKSSDSIISEHCDMLVVDWKNMSQIKITNITELQIYDLLQFKASFYYYISCINIFDYKLNIFLFYNSL